jgi:hypothetical protein
VSLCFGAWCAPVIRYASEPLEPIGFRGCLRVRQRRGKQAGGLVETIIVRKIVGAILVILVVCIVVGALLVWKPQIDPVETAKASAFNSGLVAKGAELAAIGNCAVCHTAPGGKSYAGSRPLPIPFGTIYSSNITPDSETGIGNWSEGAFRRALRDGVDRKGAISTRRFLTTISLISRTTISVRFTRLSSPENLRTRSPCQQIVVPLQHSFPSCWLEAAVPAARSAR